MASSLTWHNEGAADRTIRILLGLALVALALTGPKTPLGWIGLVPLATGALGVCPLYRMLGISTCAPRIR